MLLEEAMFLSQQGAEFCRFGHMALILESRMQKKWLCNLLSQLRNYGQACVRSVPALRPRESLVWCCEGEVWIVLEFARCWRWPNCRIPVEKAADYGWNHCTRKKCIVVNKAERSWRAEKCFHPRHRDAELGVCHACFPSFGLSVSQCSLTMLLSFPFGMIMYILCHSIVEARDLLFDFTGAYSLKNTQVSKERLDF